MDIGKAIKQIRTLKGLRQKELADRIGTTQGHLSQVEKNKTKPSLDMLENIAKQLNTPLAIWFWFTVSEEDIDWNKVEAFKICKPIIDEMIKGII